MKTFVFVFLLLAVFVFGPISAQAANRYVRASAVGANNGTDWLNAYATLPPTLTRGDTYYIASGNYASYSFDDAPSGSLIITIKKATVTDHGTEVGWNATFGQGQAVFSSVLQFSTDNWVFDGQTRNENDWFAGTAYGFRISHNDKNQNIIIGKSQNGVAANNVTVRYVFVDAIVGELPTNTILRYAIDTDTYGGTIGQNLVFSRIFVNGSNNVWFLRTTNGAIVEYSASDNAASNAANHGEIVNLYYSGNNAIIRYNKFRNAYLDDWGTALVAIVNSGGLQFYGNLAWDFGVTDGTVGFSANPNTSGSSNNRIYNNTFIGGVGYNSGHAFDGGTGNIVENNLYINCKSVGITDAAHDYNGFSDSNVRGEANAQINIPNSLFISFAGKDFRLASATKAGKTLSAPHNTDLMNNTRGSDGIWDRGAFELSGGIMPPPPSPSEFESSMTFPLLR